MQRDQTLAIVSPLRGFPLGDSKILLTEKFIDGIKMYRELWDGPVIHLCEPADRPSYNLDNMEINLKAPEFETLCAEFSEDYLRGTLPPNSLVVSSVGEQFNYVSKICKELRIPCIYISEYSLKTRYQQIVENQPNLVRGAWQTLRQIQQEIFQRKAISIAEGLQCNGLPTFNAYKSINQNPHLFFDSRTTSDMLATPDQVRKRCFENKNGRKLRLAFSGRLTAIKGVVDLLHVAQHLRPLLNDCFELSIYGDGDYADRLKADIDRMNLGDLVKLPGNLDFKSQLLPLIKDHTDIFVCCHRQGDPSCTYLETMACGVPIVGYNNEAWAMLCSHSKTGISVKLGDTQKMAEQIAKLGLSEFRIEEESRNSLEFAARHTFEQTYRRRIEHFKDIAEHMSRKD
jgi:glycosyltransferase involved in cell wall biosynthesis